MAYSHHRQFPLPLRSVLLASATLALLVGCGGGDDDPAGRQAKIVFEPQVNGKGFACGATYTGVGLGLPGAYQINDWRFYVHDVTLIRPDGGREGVALYQDDIWQYQNVALLDPRKNCGSGALPTNATVIGNVTNTTCTGICFKVGLPFALNHLDQATAPAPLNNAGMVLNARDGRIFIRVDGVGDPANLDEPFDLHLSSAGCPGSDPSKPPTAACGYPNVAEFCLNDFNLDQDHIIMDIGKALAASNVVVNTPNTPPGCLSSNADPECIPVIPRLNLDFTYIPGPSMPLEQYNKVVPQVLFSVHKP